MNNAEEIKFEFGWLALKLLGKSLYSNAWSAISELVANGFDAGANNVYIYINRSSKQRACVEIFDDGSGMNYDGVETYVKIGYNKRENPSLKKNDYLLMGRKGIGKLAALYLSESYYIVTKTNNSSLTWQMQYRENDADKEAKPSLARITNDIEITCKKDWDSCITGTMIRMENVNLSGLGDAAFESLKRKLANSFALDSMDNRKIHLCVVDKVSQPIKFDLLKKEIAFKNMAFITYSFDGATSLSSVIEENRNNIIKMQYKKVKGNHFYEHHVNVERFSDIDKIEISNTIEIQNIRGEIVKKNYSLSGWIGLHSTIEKKLAIKNDPVFVKNDFYNPIQLRLYVRNKLAVENFLNIINNTQAFVNYIEGEIHFDILDDDDLPDIATSNRQGIDEHDQRVLILKDIIGKIITHIISKRTNLAEDMKNKEEELKAKQEQCAKKNYMQEMDKEISNLDNVPQEAKNQLLTVAANKLEGDVSIKSDYAVFLSHASEDKRFTHFIYHLLMQRGANDDEIFYTSKDDTIKQGKDLRPLSSQIKNSIINHNTLILFLASKDYKKSEYCMFEGGAGWATRAVGDYIMLPLTYSEIPAFLTNGKKEFSLERDKRIVLDRLAYLNLVDIFNTIINHLNRGRTAKSEPLIPLFSEEKLPSDIDLAEKNENLSDYFDSEILRFWKFYVEKDINEYLMKRNPPKEEEK